MLFHLPPLKVGQGKRRKVSSAHVEGIRREARIAAGDVMSVTRPEILHADGLSDLAAEGVEDFGARGLLIDVAEGIEVPVVVIPESAGGTGAARCS